MKSVFGVAAVISGFAAVGQAGAASPLADWNLIVATNLHTSSEVDGSALIGGSVFGTSNYSIHGVTASNGDGLAVGGNIGAGINVQVNSGGNLRIGGSVLGTVNVNGGVTITDPTTATQAASAFAQVQGISTFLKGLAANSSVDGAGNFNATPTLIGGQQVAVFTVSSSLFIGSLGQLNLNIGSAQSVIINVDAASTGGVVDLIAPPNIIGGFSQANSGHILWNMYNATSVLVNNSFNGALLATGADLQLTGGAINGSVVVNSVSQQSAEIRRFNYTGYIPGPGGAAVLGGLGLAAARRRR